MKQCFRGDNSELVFKGEGGRKINPHHLCRHFKATQKKVGVKNIIRFHDLRHTFASQFMMNSGNIYDLQKVLGHSKIDMTMVYAHLSPEHLSGATKIISFGNFQSSEPLLNHNGSLEEKVLLFGEC